MDEELTFLLLTYFNEDMQELLRNCIVLLESINCTDVDDKILELIHTDSSRNNTDVPDELRSYVTLCIYEQLKQHGIFLDADTPLRMLYRALNAIVLLGGYLDSETIINTIDVDCDDTETLVNLFQLVSVFEVHELDPYVEFINPSLFLRIREQFQQILDGIPEPADVATEREIINNVKELGKFFNKDDFLAIQLLRENTPVKLSIEFYILPHADQLAALPYSDVAREILVLCYMCDSTLLVDTYKKALATIYTDLTKIVSVDKEINKLVIPVLEHMKKFNLVGK